MTTPQTRLTVLAVSLVLPAVAVLTIDDAPARDLGDAVRVVANDERERDLAAQLDELDPQLPAGPVEGDGVTVTRRTGGPADDGTGVDNADDGTEGDGTEDGTSTDTGDGDAAGSDAEEDGATAGDEAEADGEAEAVEAEEVEAPAPVEDAPDPVEDVTDGGGGDGDDEGDGEGD